MSPLPGAFPRGSVRAVAVHPRLWRTALVQLFRLADAGWWRHWPPLPRPASRWLAFRLETQYGSGQAEPSAEDLVAWLWWCREADQEPSRWRGVAGGVR
jgi:hypothetical protein